MNPSMPKKLFAIAVSLLSLTSITGNAQSATLKELSGALALQGYVVDVVKPGRAVKRAIKIEKDGLQAIIVARQTRIKAQTVKTFCGVAIFPEKTKLDLKQLAIMEAVNGKMHFIKWYADTDGDWVFERCEMGHGRDAQELAAAFDTSFNEIENAAKSIAKIERSIRQANIEKSVENPESAPVRESRKGPGGRPDAPSRSACVAEEQKFRFDGEDYRIYVDEDGDSYAIFVENKTIVFSTKPFYWFDEVFRDVHNDKEVNACLGLSSVGRGTDCRKQKATHHIANNGKIRGIGVSFEDNPFLVHAFRDYLNRDHDMQVSIANGKLYTGVTINKNNCLK